MTESSLKRQAGNRSCLPFATIATIATIVGDDKGRITLIDRRMIGIMYEEDDQHCDNI